MMQSQATSLLKEIAIRIPAESCSRVDGAETVIDPREEKTWCLAVTYCTASIGSGVTTYPASF